MSRSHEKHLLLEELKKQPIIFVACKKLGIGRTTLYRWRDTDLVFKKKLEKALSEGRRNVVDIAESQLFKAMSKGEAWAIRYTLESNSKRYIRPRKAVNFDVATPYRGITNFNITVAPGKTTELVPTDGKMVPNPSPEASPPVEGTNTEQRDQS